LVTTHDLALADITGTLASGRAIVHFEIISRTARFIDYHLRRAWWSAAMLFD